VNQSFQGKKKKKEMSLKNILKKMETYIDHMLKNILFFPIEFTNEEWDFLVGVPSSFS